MDSKTRQQILSLSSDLRRIAWWAVDSKLERKHLIEKFLKLVKHGKEKIADRKIKEIIGAALLKDWEEVKAGIKDKRIWAEGVLTASLRLKHLAETLPF